MLCKDGSLLPCCSYRTVVASRQWRRSRAGLELRLVKAVEKRCVMAFEADAIAIV